MIKKTITFKDFNGVERTEDHYFNISEAEMVELELGETGGFTEKVHRIISAQDNPTIMKTFKELIEISYGIKSPDGREFQKSPEITRSFMQTNAYNKFFMELCTKEGAASDFVNALIPTVSESSEISAVK